MTELSAPDVPASAAWYERALGLSVVLSDPATGFVLLAAPGGGGRLALKPGPAAGGVTLHFEVPDLPAAVERLLAAGAAVGAVKRSAEGYTRARAADPAGTAVVVYAWDAG